MTITSKTRNPATDEARQLYAVLRTAGALATSTRPTPATARATQARWR